MPDPVTNEILWYNPDPRTIIPLDRFHVSRSLRQSAKRDSFQITFDKDFASVVDGCAARDQTWISEGIKQAYVRLYNLGLAHSVEVWNEAGLLVGGLYGLSQGGVFNAESMFSRKTNASKIALWALISRMKDCGLTLLEVQFMTEHLKTMGAIEIPRTDYLNLLEIALGKSAKFNGKSCLSSSLPAGVKAR